MLTSHTKHGSGQSGALKRNESLIQHIKNRRSRFHIRETVDRLSDFIDEEVRRYKIARMRHTSWELIPNDDVYLPDHVLEQRVGAVSVKAPSTTTPRINDKEPSLSLETLSIRDSDEKDVSTDAAHSSTTTEISDWEDDFHTCQESITGENDDLEHLLPTEICVHSGDLFTPSSHNGMVGSTGTSGKGMPSLQMRLRAIGGVENNIVSISITLKCGEQLEWRWKPQPISKTTPASEVPEKLIEDAHRGVLVVVKNNVVRPSSNAASELTTSSSEPPRLSVRRSNGEELTNPRWSTVGALHQHFE